MNFQAKYNRYSYHFYSKLTPTMIFHNALYPLLYLDVPNYTFKNLLSTFLNRNKRVGLLNCSE